MEDRTEGSRTLVSDPRRAIPVLAVPLAVAVLVQNLNGMADSLWASWLGAGSVGGLGISYSYYSFLIGIGNGVGVGTASSIGRSVGLKDRGRASACACQSLLIIAVLSVSVGLPMAFFARELLGVIGSGEILDRAVDYSLPIFMFAFFPMAAAVMSGILRGEGAARSSMMIQVVGAVVNLVLDPVLMYGFGLGVSGAGVATVVAGAVSLLIGLSLYLGKGGMYVSFSAAGFRPDKEVCKEILNVAVPQSAEYTTISLINIPMHIIIIGVAGNGVIGLYASGWKVAYMTLIPAQAFAGALVPVCSAERAMGRTDMMEEAFLYSVKTTIKLTGLLCVALAALSYPIAYAFTVTDDLAPLRDNMVLLLLCIAASIPVMSQIFVGSAFMQTVGHSGTAFLSSLVRNIVLVAAYYLVSVTVGNSEGMWIALMVCEIFGGWLMYRLARMYLDRMKSEDRVADL